MNNKINKIIEVLIILLLGVILTLGFIYINEDKDEKQQSVNSSVEIIETDSINAAVNKVYEAVVLIESYSKGKLISTGTGFVYKTDDEIGYIFTNQHVVEDSDEVRIVYIDGSKTDGKLLGSDVLSDVAVLSVDKDTVLKVATLGNSKDSKLGDTIFTVGSPLGEDYMGTVTKGIVSGLNRNINVSTSSGDNVMEVMQIDAAINPGNSGGPLVNLKGQVIGINSIKLVQNEVEGMGFSIPIELALSLAPNLESGKKVDRPVFGVTSTTVDDLYNLRLEGIVIDSSVKSGIVVIDVEKGSAADVSNLKKGDVIYEVDGKEITDIGSFRYVLYKHKVGDKIDVKYYRGTDKKEVTVTLIK